MNDDMRAESGQQKGGRARAKALTKQQLQVSARHAAQARWQQDGEALPRALYLGAIKIGDAEIPCAVLEDGRRLLTQGGFLRAMGRSRRPKGGQGTVDDSLPFLAAKNLEPFIHGVFRASTNPVKFRTLRGAVAWGYGAELLPEVCRVFVLARQAGKLTSHQSHVADKCELLLAGLATVGIIALVDEATGYQKHRNRNALEQILAAYVNPELLPWSRRFPDSYYKEMFRLLGWEYSPPQLKRPKYIGKWTDELIYKHLPPGVREELRSKSPPNEKGNRPNRLHQFLTEDIGNPHLQNQITAVTTLMRASRDKSEFRRLFRAAFPRASQQLALPVIDQNHDESYS